MDNGSQSDKKKTCTACKEIKLLTDFYPKGSRLDSRCKSCVLKKKGKSRNKQKAKSALLKAVRRKSKILVFTEDQIVETLSEVNSIDLNHLENLLRQFSFDSICRSGGEHEEK